MTKADTEKKAAEQQEEERVMIMIPLVEGQDSEVTVGVNGVFTKIKKGVPVKVSKAVAGVLRNSYHQAMIQQQNSKKFERQVTDFN